MASAILSTFSGSLSSVPIAANSNLSSIRNVVIYHLTLFYEETDKSLMLQQPKKDRQENLHNHLPLHLRACGAQPFPYH
jgi:hypothetical protein